MYYCTVFIFGVGFRSVHLLAIFEPYVFSYAGVNWLVAAAS